jgi:thiol:disulfide interchange protein DsbA
MQFFKSAVIVLAMASSACLASPASPMPGAEYHVLRAAQPTQATGKQVEVIEFFMYHCPACYAIDAQLAAWVKKRGDSIVFRRIHIPHSLDNDPEARLFLTLESMQLEEALHDKIMATWHVERLRLKSDADNLEWVLKHGVDKEKFLEHYHSFSIMAKLKGLSRMAGRYGVESTPSLVIDGRFLTSPGLVAASNKHLPAPEVIGASFQVLDALVDKAARTK